MNQTPDRDVWDYHVKEWWSKPVSEERKKEIEGMNEDDLAEIVFRKADCYKEKQYATSVMLRRGRIDDKRLEK